eukprot:scaffold31838_cov61-Attheya_sp.AAC.2
MTERESKAKVYHGNDSRKVPPGRMLVVGLYRASGRRQIEVFLSSVALPLPSLPHLHHHLSMCSMHEGGKMLKSLLK